jgi:hypothetical protein
MDCNIILENLPAYLEESLSSQQRNEIAGHLLSCSSCSAVLDDLRECGRVVRALDAVEPPAWMTERIMARIRKEERKGIVQRLFLPLHLKIPIQAFATVLIVIAAMYVFKSVQPEMDRSVRQEIKRSIQPAPGERDALLERPSKPSPVAIPDAETARPKGVTETRKENQHSAAAQSRNSGLIESPVMALRQAPASAPSENTEKSAQESKSKEALEGMDSTAYKAPEPALAAREPTRAAPSRPKQEQTGMMRAKSLSAPPPMAKAIQVRASLYATDPVDALAQVEKLLTDNGVLNVEKESHPGLQLVAADLRMESIEPILNGLRKVGDLREVIRPDENGTGEVRIQISVFGPD